jgi:hypothetical protein
MTLVDQGRSNVANVAMSETLCQCNNVPTHDLLLDSYLSRYVTTLRSLFLSYAGTLHFDLRDDQDLDSVLCNCQDANLTTHKLFQITLTDSLPKLSSHKFWSQTGLAIEDGKSEDSVVVNIVAYGNTESDATGLAMMKLISTVKLARKLIAHSKNVLNESFRIEQVQSLMVGSSRLHIK